MRNDSKKSKSNTPKFPPPGRVGESDVADLHLNCKISSVRP